MISSSLENEPIVVTGAAGQVARPIVEFLAPRNRVTAIDHFSDEEKRRQLEALGVTCIRWDVGTGALDDLPDEPAWVLHFAAFSAEGSEDFERALTVNAVGTGRLMSHFRRAKGFLHCSSTAIYRYRGHTPLTEDSPLADRMAGPFPVYSMTKIAGEAVARFASLEWSIPTTIARLNTPYGRNGGMPAMHLTSIVNDLPIVLHPDKPSYFNPAFEEDYVRQAERLVQAGAAPPVIVNWCGSERVSVEEYCTYIGTLLGKEPRFVYSEEGMGSTCCDVTRMHELIGPTTVPWREGMRQMVEAMPRDVRMASEDVPGSSPRARERPERPR